jgi:hypothetical protein
MAEEWYRLNAKNCATYCSIGTVHQISDVPCLMEQLYRLLTNHL